MSKTAKRKEHILVYRAESPSLHDPAILCYPYRSVSKRVITNARSKLKPRYRISATRDQMYLLQEGLVELREYAPEGISPILVLHARTQRGLQGLVKRLGLPKPKRYHSSFQQ